MNRRFPPLRVLALALGVVACAPDTYLAPTDFEREGTWQADGMNDRNLRAMVADPSHLTRGVGAATDRGAAGAAAATALNCGRRPVMAANSISEIGSENNTPRSTGVTTGGPGDIGRSAACGGTGAGAGGSTGGNAGMGGGFSAR